MSAWKALGISLALAFGIGYLVTRCESRDIAYVTGAEKSEVEEVQKGLNNTIDSAKDTGKKLYEIVQAKRAQDAGQQHDAPKGDLERQVYEACEMFQKDYDSRNQSRGPE